MGNLAVVLRLIVFVWTSFGFVSVDGEPCNASGNLSNVAKRNTSNTSGSLCDVTIEEKWYRIQDGEDLDMPTSCVTYSKCGTSYPIWMNGTIPDVSEGAVTRKACISSLLSCCASYLNIMVKNCGHYRVYNLVQTNGCHQAYCFVVAPSSSSTSAPSTTTVSTTKDGTKDFYTSTASSSGANVISTQSTKPDGTTTVAIGQSSTLDMKTVIIIVLVAVIIVLVVAALILGLIWYKRRNIKDRNYDDAANPKVNGKENSYMNGALFSNITTTSETGRSNDYVANYEKGDPYSEIEVDLNTFDPSNQDYTDLNKQTLNENNYSLLDSQNTNEIDGKKDACEVIPELPARPNDYQNKTEVRNADDNYDDTAAHDYCSINEHEISRNADVAEADVNNVNDLQKVDNHYYTKTQLI